MQDTITDSADAQIHFLSEYRRGPFDFWFEETSPLFDIVPIAAEKNTGRFEVRSHVSTAGIILNARYDAQSLRLTKRHSSHASDLIFVQRFARGGSIGRAGDTAFAHRPGDIAIVDHGHQFEGLHEATHLCGVYQAEVDGGAFAGTAIGAVSDANGVHATALGAYAKANALDSVALGANSVASEVATVSFGRSDDPLTANVDETLRRRLTYVAAGINDTDAVNVAQLSAVETNVAANSASISALEDVGTYVALNSDDTAARADFDESLAIGGKSVASAEYAMAIGHNSRAEVEGGLAIGTNADAGTFRSVALGYGAATQEAYQFMFGTSAHTYTMPGLVSDTSRTRQTGATELVTTDSQGNLATDGGSTVSGL